MMRKTQQREKKKSHMKQRVAEPALSAASLLGVLLADGHVLHDVVGGAHGHGRPLVDALRLDVQDVLVARGGHAARLLHDEGHGDALVQQPQLQGERRRWVSVLRGGVLLILLIFSLRVHVSYLHCKILIFYRLLK